ncbi:hypothetical protein TGMAS_204045 [Toxoplasma gondii MAS]|uniref:Uncharacterized protein n=2 Tax=Toxoplasma gondii TaxID=5811 RepID=A0A086PZ80_TOXGO|nr:hypothetical protein TGMAS_204045 [Toxoplasma gondii MAS]PUA89306.1 hypothetical protein TGBR9_204045 [Toxoplasma gondii TgCATBr9]
MGSSHDGVIYHDFLSDGSGLIMKRITTWGSDACLSVPEDSPSSIQHKDRDARKRLSRGLHSTPKALLWNGLPAGDAASVVDSSGPSEIGTWSGYFSVDTERAKTQVGAELGELRGLRMRGFSSYTSTS